MRGRCREDVTSAHPKRVMFLRTNISEILVYRSMWCIHITVEVFSYGAIFVSYSEVCGHRTQYGDSQEILLGRKRLYEETATTWWVKFAPDNRCMASSSCSETTPNVQATTPFTLSQRNSSQVARAERCLEVP